MGPIIREWNENRVIRPRVKAAAAVAVVLVMTPALVFGGLSPALKAVSIGVGLGVITMICRQASR
jgi:uncharacterized membrane protein YbaN (DUF454 family)